MAENSETVGGKPEEKPWKQFTTRMAIDPAQELTQDQADRLLAQKKWEHINAIGEILHQGRQARNIPYFKRLRDPGYKITFDPYLEITHGISDEKFPEIALRSRFLIET